MLPVFGAIPIILSGMRYSWREKFLPGMELRAAVFTRVFESIYIAVFCLMFPERYSSILKLLEPVL